MEKLPSKKRPTGELSKNLKSTKNRQSNLTEIFQLVRSPEKMKIEIRLDTFKNEIMISPVGKSSWRRLTDNDYGRFRLRLESLGLSVSKELVKDAINLAASENTFDTAIEWLTNEVPEHDKKPRISKFFTTYFGAEDTPYTDAVSIYLWTALAGRVLQPGIKADMVPILSGPQGAGKSTGIEAISPSPEFFTEISLHERDDNQARKMRGCLVGEIAELRGLNSREVEAIKAFITRTKEEWIPKYQEFPMTYQRRIVLIGTTNETNFLSDESGNRRWLPLRVDKINLQKLKEDRLQLWAEARDTFKQSGIQFREAEKLAKLIHSQFLIIDGWASAIQDWLSSNTLSELTTESILTTCLGFESKNITIPLQMRAGRVLRSLGFIKKQKRIGKSMKNIYVLEVLDEDTEDPQEALNEEEDDTPPF